MHVTSRSHALLAIGTACAICIMSTHATVDASEPVESLMRDGSKDFDFNVGTWSTHITRLRHPLTPATDAISFDGTVTVRKVWDGRAQLEEIDADGPNGSWQGLTLFLYDPSSHQWSQSFANSSAGVLQTPTVGSFADGQAELISQDVFEGKTILVRGIWSEIKKDSHRYEEAYSADGGKSWQTVITALLMRVGS